MSEAEPESKPVTIRPSDGAVLAVTKAQLAETLRQHAADKEALLADAALMRAACFEENARAEHLSERIEAERVNYEAQIASLGEVVADLRARLNEDADSRLDQSPEADAGA